MSNLVDCKDCGHQVSKNAKTCPNCGVRKPSKGHLGRRMERERLERKFREHGLPHTATTILEAYKLFEHDEEKIEKLKKIQKEIFSEDSKAALGGFAILAVIIGAIYLFTRETPKNMPEEIAVESQIINVGSLSNRRKKELMFFGMEAMGFSASINDIEVVLPQSDINQMVEVGLNLNGHLCAELVAIAPLRVNSTYEATCIEYRGGSGRKRYIIDALNGVAFVP